MHLVDGGAHPQGEGGDTGHRDDHDEHGVQEALVEHRVLEELDVVVQAGKALDAAQAVFRKAVEYADEHGNDNEADKEDQAGQEEQVGGDGLSPNQRLTHSGELGTLFLFGLLAGGYGILRHKYLPSFNAFLVTSGFQQ